ncbi:MAG: hypothetical protein Fur005_05090 [Roseiflexaceae bacterium]
MFSLLAQLRQRWQALPLFGKGIGLGGVVLIIGAIWAYSPLLYDVRVDEEFPLVAVEATASGNEMADPMMTGTTIALLEPSPMVPTVPVATVLILSSVPATVVLPTESPTIPTATVAPSPVPTFVPTVAPTIMPTVAPTVAPTTEPTPSEPLLLHQGVFIAGSVPGDRAEGRALIYQLTDGSRIVRLEDFSTTNGPDLFVTLHTGGNPERDTGEYLVLERLKGNQGNQNYSIPVTVDLSQYRSVVIWCRAFDVTFGYALFEQ